MIIKRHQNKNDYCLADGGLWVRDFTKKYVSPKDINNFITPNDIETVLENEIYNSQKMFQFIETENFTHHKIAVISDGYKFDEKQHLLESLPNDVIVMGVNGSLAGWQSSRRMNYYVVNNPYDDCLNYLPKSQMWPRCIASSRTNPAFIENYGGLIYIYHPVVDENYKGINPESDFYVDDYRNTICATIGLAYKFEVKKLLFLCLDDFYTKERPATIKIDENKWIYPQQKMAHDLIDANLYWLNKKVKIGYHCDGLKYDNATYITEERIRSFFEE